MDKVSLLEGELEEYKALHWPHGRCLSCKFPLKPSKSYKRCQNKDCDEVIVCQRIGCQSVSRVCGICNENGCTDCQWNCTRCERSICHKCDDVLNCKSCGGDQGTEESLCGDCLGPFHVFDLRYAKNVKRPERLVGCQSCYTHWTTSWEYTLMRDCEHCAVENYPGQKCDVSDCFEHFCHHIEPDRQYCDTHLKNKKARVDKVN